LRLHGLIQRVAKTNRYQSIAQGMQVAMFFSRTYARLLRPGLAEIAESDPPTHPAARSLAATHRLRSRSERHRSALRRSQTRRMKLDSITPKPMNQGL